MALEELRIKDVTIGVLTALTWEFTACRHVLDPEGQGREVARIASSGNLICWLCRVRSLHGGHHVVAITQLPEMGNNIAAIAANILLQHCPRLRYLIMSGIAGAIPSPKSPENHVRLGDIVVSNSTGVIQYDRGKQMAPEEESPDPTMPAVLRSEFNLRSLPRAPSPDMLRAVSSLISDQQTVAPDLNRPWEDKAEQFLTRFADAPKWKRPRVRDVLNDTPKASGANTPHPRDPDRRSRRPKLFSGTVGSANVVLSNPEIRNYLRDRHGCKAVEMEGSGVADASWMGSVGYLIVRGTCDYCNGMKGDKWHPYAALIAASFTCCVIEKLHPVLAAQTGQEPDESPNFPGVNDAIRESQRVASANFSNIPTKQSASQATTSRNDTVAFNPNSSQPDTSAQQVVTSHMLQTVLNMGIPSRVMPDSSSALTLLSRDVNEYLLRGQEDKLYPAARQLELQLLALPRRGRATKDAWILLGRVELQRLNKQRLSGQQVDMARLKSLRAEAENVVI